MPLGPAVHGREAGVGDDLDGLVDVVEDDEVGVEAEEEVGEIAVVGGGGREFFGLVIADGVIAGVADQAAGERGEAGDAREAARGEQPG